MATLRDVPVERLVEATQRLAVEAPADGGLPLALLPVVDGVFLERPPGEMIAEGAAAAVPVLLGTTRDECALFTTADHGNPEVDETRVAHRLAGLVGPAGADVVDAYRMRAWRPWRARDRS